MINGKDVLISVRADNGVYYPIACDLSCTITMQRDVLAVTGPGAGLWRRIIPGNRIIASITGNGMITYNKNMSILQLQQVLIAGTQVRVMCEIPADDTVSGSVSYETLAYVTKAELTGAFRAAGSLSYELQIDGEISIISSAVPDPAEIGFTNELLLGDGTADKLASDSGADSNILI